MSGEADVLPLIRNQRLAVFRTLMMLVLALGLVSFTAATRSFPGDDVVERLSGLTTVRSLATWTTTIILFACAVLAMVASRLDPRSRGYWRSGAFGLIVLSMEEVIGLHEMSDPSLRDLEPIVEAPSVTWLVAALAVAALLATVAFPLLRRLPQPIRIRFIAAGVLIVAGAIGLQYLGEAVAFNSGLESTQFVAIHTLEELAELMGFVFLLDGLALFLSIFEASHSADLRRGSAP